MQPTDGTSFIYKRKELTFAMVGGTTGLVQAWTSRETLYPDSLNYLALAKTLVTRGWSASVNGFWSPMYSWLLAIPLANHQLPPERELLWVHLIGFLIFLWAMFCFHVFVTRTFSLARMKYPDSSFWQRVEPLWYLVACSAFLFSTFRWLPNGLTTPDFLMCAFIFLSSGLLASVAGKTDSWRTYIALGVALGFGYLAKAPAFPLSIIFILSLAVILKGHKLAFAKWVLTASLFLLVSGPYLYTVSNNEGHPTFGESGRIAFVIFVNGAPAYWLGEISPTAASANYETVCQKPQVIAFRETVPGTYFPSYSPSQWYAGLKPHLDVSMEARNLREGWRTLFDMSAVEADLCLALSILALFAGLSKAVKSVFGLWFVWLPAVLGTIMFWVVHVEERFVAPFVILGFVGAGTALLSSNYRRARTVTAVLVALLIVQGTRATITVAKSVAGQHNRLARDTIQTLGDLQSWGVPPGSSVAIVGAPKLFYWAWAGQYVIKGLIPDSGTMPFLSSNPIERENTYACLAQTGAEAVVIDTDFPEFLGTGWHSAGPGNLYVRLLNGRSK